MAVADTDLGQGIGARLSRAREERGLSVEECAERLYLPATVLQALEAEQFAVLGAGVYARGHLRRYAGLLEMDAAGLEQMMLQRLAAAPDLATIVTRRVGDTRPSRRLGLLPVAIVAGVLALAVLVWWSVRHANGTAPVPAPIATPVPTPGTGSATAAPPAAALAAPAGSVATGTGAAVPLVVAEATPRSRPAASPRRVQPEPESPPVPPPVPRETQRDYMNFDN
jgi:cytoskeleton protein RodZ